MNLLDWTQYQINAYQHYIYAQGLQWSSCGENEVYILIFVPLALTCYARDFPAQPLQYHAVLMKLLMSVLVRNLFRVVKDAAMQSVAQTKLMLMPLHGLFLWH